MSGGNQTTPPLPQLEYGKVEEITEETTEEITTEETIEETTDLYKLTESSSTSESPDSSLSDSGFKDAEAPSTSESPDSSPSDYVFEDANPPVREYIDIYVYK